MNDRTIETFQFGDRDRVRVVPDDSPQCPRGDWHMLTGFYNLSYVGNRNFADVPAVHEWPGGDLDQAYQSLSHENIQRWARIFYGLVIEYDQKHGGFWFVAGADAATAATPVDTYSRCLFYDNWPGLMLGSPEHLAKQAEVIEQERETYREWADGEVYGMIHEKLSTWTKVPAEGEELAEAVTRDEWDEEESLWGTYGDDLREHARETFGLPADEPEVVAP